MNLEEKPAVGVTIDDITPRLFALRHKGELDGGHAIAAA
jgi:hypothetical protein